MDDTTLKRSYGFTLIELLVVIAIISLLSSIVMASLNTARAKARDAQKVATLRQVQNALELYYDKYGYYPDYANVGGRDCSGFQGDQATSNTFMSLLVTGGFLGSVVADPRGLDCRFQYRDETPNAGTNNAQGYRILFLYETKTNNDLQCYPAGGWSCVRSNYP